jgi:hypothetical protein
VEVWEVRGRAGGLVLRFSDEPGPIIGTAGSVPGSKPPHHPFFSVIFLSAQHEPPLRALVGLATSREDFARRLRAEGFTVVRIGD